MPTIYGDTTMYGYLDVKKNISGNAVSSGKTTPRVANNLPSGSLSTFTNGIPGAALLSTGELSGVSSISTVNGTLSLLSSVVTTGSITTPSIIAGTVVSKSVVTSVRVPITLPAAAAAIALGANEVQWSQPANTVITSITVTCVSSPVVEAAANTTLQAAAGTATTGAQIVMAVSLTTANVNPAVGFAFPLTLLSSTAAAGLVSPTANPSTTATRTVFLNLINLVDGVTTAGLFNFIITYQSLN